nr:CHC2 zinc finger domain-containing protein [uncultured Muribaculum sp.]
MKTIDRETVQRILDTADIVEVVSDFVTLKRRGTSYLGLCPFHNERTPSFSVSSLKIYVSALAAARAAAL